jgi:hypothetical protein
MIRRAVIHQVGEFAPFSTAAVNARKPQRGPFRSWQSNHFLDRHARLCRARNRRGI